MAWETDWLRAMISAAMAVRLAVLWAPSGKNLGGRREGGRSRGELASTDRCDLWRVSRMSGVSFRRRPVCDGGRTMSDTIEPTGQHLLHSTDFKYRFRRTLKRTRGSIAIGSTFTYISSGLEGFVRFGTGQRHKLTGRVRIVVVVLLFVSFVETRLEVTLTTGIIAASTTLTSPIVLANDTSSARMPVDRRLPRRLRFTFGLSVATDFNGAAAAAAALFDGNSLVILDD